MKKLVAMVLACMLLASAAYAGEWTDGLSPAKPHPLKDEVNLEETIGYIMLFPSAKLPVERFCDVLEIYLPREDLERGEGSLRLYDDDGLVAELSFADEDSVELRPLEDSELPRYWGGGTCVEAHLPVSLQFEKNYYVLMDEGCFTGAEGKVKNPAITAHDAWQPVLAGDYGVSGLYYSAPAPAPEAPEEGEEPEETQTPAPTEGPIEPKVVHEIGDVIHFDLVIGGDAKMAVVFSENDSANFETQQYTESCAVTGTIMKDDLDWGVVFMDENGAILEQDGTTVGVLYLA